MIRWLRRRREERLKRLLERFSFRPPTGFELFLINRFTDYVKESGE